jgi:hypothetical protein
MGEIDAILGVCVDREGIDVEVVDPWLEKLPDFTFKLLQSGFEKF